MKEHNFEFKKSLGQNFLVDKNISKKIINSLSIDNEDIIIEIGPGTGALTTFLLEKDILLGAVEIDFRAVSVLQEKYKSQDYPKFHLFNEDIRKFNISAFRDKFNKDKKVKIIGNIPYNISSDIFFWILENSNLIDKATLMLQKEVAERIIAKKSTKDYGILTASLALLGTGKILFHIPPTCFQPQPKVTSSIIELDFSTPKVSIEKYKLIKELIRSAFNQRRKMMSNSLKNYFTKYNIDYTGFSDNEILNEYLSKRAEALTADDFIILYDEISKYFVV